MGEDEDEQAVAVVLVEAAAAVYHKSLSQPPYQILVSNLT